jgi:hypothetical protein
MHTEPRETCLRDLLHARLKALLRTLGQKDKLPAALRVADLLSQGWAPARLSSGPAWPSDITDDHTPFELSLAFSTGGETARILTEPQDFQQPTAAASWALAQRIHERLASDWGANLTVLNKLGDLFEPDATTRARFAVWHSAVLGDMQRPDFKIYLNPCIQGVSESAPLVRETLERLGMSDAWRRVQADALRRGDADTPLYVSLDLSSSNLARVKVYIAHHAATAHDVADALAGCPGYGREQLVSWMTLLMGGEGPYEHRPPLTCFAFCDGVLDPHSATLHCPVRAYGGDDFEIARRAVALLTFRQRVRYLRVLTNLCDRPLDAGRGLQTYISVRNSPGNQALTVYLAPEAYAPQTAAEGEVATEMLRSFSFAVLPSMSRGASVQDVES